MGSWRSAGWFRARRAPRGGYFVLSSPIADKGESRREFGSGREASAVPGGATCPKRLPLGDARNDSSRSVPEPPLALVELERQRVAAARVRSAAVGVRGRLVVAHAQLRLLADERDPATGANLVGALLRGRQNRSPEGIALPTLLGRDGGPPGGRGGAQVLRRGFELPGRTVDALIPMSGRYAP